MGTARLHLAFVALLLLGSARPAAAERAAGRRAPDLHAAATLGAPAPISVDGLRGRLVLLVFFRTDCPHCRSSVEALRAMQRAGFDRGLRVVGVTRDPRPAVEAFLRELSAEFPAVLVDTEVLRDYDVTGFPSAFLVGPDGRLLWTGRPGALTETEVARRLAATPPWPEVPASFDPLLRALREDRWSEAETGFGVCSAPDSCDVKVATAANAMLRWIDRTAEGLLAGAEADLARGDVYDAWRASDRLAVGFGDRVVGPRAARQAAAILADPARAREVAAGRAFEAARKRWDEEGLAAGIAALEAVAAAHPGTSAATQAGEMAARLRKRR